MAYNPVIGLEIHAELNTQSKMFCSCKNDPFEKTANLNVCPVCMGHPGTLPLANEEAIKKVIKTGLALNCQIPDVSKFDRKNYFYPDLPKGYQISQYDQPLCKEGFLEIDGKKIRVRRVHLEEDTGKLSHSEKENYSLVDYNRAGVPLMELVTEPDIKSGEEAREFSEELQLIFRYLGVSDADMEKGQMRVEVNISLAKEGAKEFGTKVEIKNLNSFHSVERAINFEILRQSDLLDEGKRIVHETRGWDDVKLETFHQREKEEAHDYRYFPEPDLPTLYLSRELVEEIKAEIPELPGQKRNRLQDEYQLNEKTADIFVQNKDLGEYFEKVASEFKENFSQENQKELIRLGVNYLVSDLQGLAQANNVQVDSEGFKITAENFSEFIGLIEAGKISSKIAKMILGEMFKTGADPSHIIEEKGLAQVNDESELEKTVKEILDKFPKAVGDYRQGKAGAFQFLIGQIMAITKGQANPDIIRRLLKDFLMR